MLSKVLVTIKHADAKIHLSISLWEYHIEYKTVKSSQYPSMGIAVKK